uniref:CRIB domain-containing protein n=1 Tax=Talaromyces marneffei PM1 TaxID=1077442 RepID=A0A093V135_TALMA
MTPRTTSPDSWQDDMDFSQRPPTSSPVISQITPSIVAPNRVPMSTAPKDCRCFHPARGATPPTSHTPPHANCPPNLSVTASTQCHRSRMRKRLPRMLLGPCWFEAAVFCAARAEEDEFGKSAARFEVSKVFQRVPKLKKNESNDQLKRIISEPYNFHHVTHTSSTQFQALDNTSNVELVEEFSVIQASQTPEPGLKGIRAQALRSDDSLENADDLERRQPTSPTSPLRRSPPVSPREPRSPGRVENFSRPVSRLNKSLPPSPSIIAPPRVSSRQAQSDIPEPTSLAIDELLGVNIQPTIRDYEYPSLDSASFRMVPSLDRIDLAGIFQPELSHAMMGSQLQTTNDPSIEDDGKTTTPFINSYLFDLEDVPEEDETKETDEPIVRTSRFMSISGSIGEFVANEAKVTAAPAHESIIVVQDPQLSFTEEVTSPVLPNFQPIIQDSPVSQASNKTRRTSVAGLVQFPMTWEEDIDFCYEHEAVADCEFDWSRLSLDASRNSVPGAAMVPSLASAAKNMVPHYLQLNASSISATPDLDTGSAQSILTRSHEALTPLSDGAAHGGFFNAGPADHEYPKKLETGDVDNETAYESFLAVGDDSERQFQYYTQTSHPVDVTASPRSSYSQISKYNSQESVILSRAASIVRKHRSSTSTTSVPELTNSANSSRENTIRGSIGSLEHTPLGAMSEASRPGFSIHRPIKSLGSELSALAKLRSAGSNSSIHVVDLPYPSPSPTHDRTKSTSTLDHDDEHQAMQSVQGLPFAVRQSLAAQKRKSRAGYSLFPTLQ